MIDSRFPELDWFLQGVRRRLNLRWLAGEAFRFATVAGAAAVVPLFFLPPPTPRVQVWTALTLVAAAVGTALGWRRRLTPGQAAAWLDETRGGLGLFGAAVEALARNAERFPDTAILKEADRARRDEGPFLWPWKRLALRFATTVGVVVACLGLLTLPGPLGGRPSSPATTAPSLADAPVKPGEAPTLPGGKEPVLSPRDAARRLYPEDQRLAALAEEALASGDAGALESLLSQNPVSPSDGPSNPSSPGPRTGAPWSPGGGAGMGLGEPGGAASGDRSGSAGPRSPLSEGHRSDAPPDGSSRLPPGSGPGSGDRAAPGSDGSPGSGTTGTAPFSPHGGFGNPGSGHSDDKLGVPSPSSPGNRRVVLPEKGPPGFFEYVLPETGARIPLSQAAAASGRTAEAALDRSSVPQEIANAVRSYFLSLSQEAKP